MYLGKETILTFVLDERVHGHSVVYEPLVDGRVAGGFHFGGGFFFSVWSVFPPLGLEGAPPPSLQSKKKFSNLSLDKFRRKKETQDCLPQTSSVRHSELGGEAHKKKSYLAH